MFCGNGGSCADSEHICAELVGKYLKNRKPYSAISLTTNTSLLSAISNDFSFKQIFSKQIQSLGKKNDILFAITTSGKSKNKAVIEVGIMPPPIKPCIALKTNKLSKFQANAHSSELMVKPIAQSV